MYAAVWRLIWQYFLPVCSSIFKMRRSKMCHGTCYSAHARICEPREMHLGLRTLRLEGIDPDTPSSRRFSLHRVAVTASRTLHYSRWNEGAKPCLLDKPLHRPSMINAILSIHLWKKSTCAASARICLVAENISHILSRWFYKNHFNMIEIRSVLLLSMFSVW